MHQVGSISTGYKRLGGHAAGVDAGPAKELSFDVGHCLAGAGQLAGERRAGLPGADDDRRRIGSSQRDSYRMRTLGSTDIPGLRRC